MREASLDSDGVSRRGFLVFLVALGLFPSVLLERRWYGGGVVSDGSRFLVGEVGPELFVSRLS
jgi:hypothetical protein